MRRLEGVGEVKVDLKSGQAVILPAPEKSFDPTRIPQAVKDAGFTPGEVEVTAVGTLARKKKLLLLEMSGPVRHFVLAAGAKAAELAQRRDLLGQRVRVRGTLHPSHADRPAGLTVESFEIPVATAPAASKPPPGKSVTVQGKLTTEGVECQALRSRDGVLYTLVGDLKGFKVGDEVSVTGTVA
ncbi:MAG: DUF5818 domain-containing protein, partial [Terriglobia bacterium]